MPTETTNDSRLIVVTGVSRGLGRSLACGFAGAVHVVCGCARHSHTLQLVADQLGDPHRFTVVDVRDDQQVKVWSQRVLEVGVPELVVNNAGVINSNAPLWTLSVAEVDEVIDVNLRGVINVLRHFLPAMIERGRGVLVNMSSGWGRSVSASVAPYCATKWAVEGLTRSLAEELPPGLAAVPLNPGIIHTEMLESCFGPDAAGYMEPDEWASRAVPLMLGLDHNNNGQPLTV
ncbi:MAG: SDR family oxidoreductase [Planctomycetales bacterium]